MTRELSISDCGRALCVLSAEHEALQQQAFQTTCNMRQAMKRFSDEHKNILKKMAALEELRATL